MRESTNGKAARRRWARRRGSVSLAAAEGESREWPHGERRERSRWVTAAKQSGRSGRSRAFPRSAREVRVALSVLRNLRHAREREFRVRVSDTNPIMVESMASGKSLIVVAVVMAGYDKS